MNSRGTNNFRYLEVHRNVLSTRNVCLTVFISFALTVVSLSLMRWRSHDDRLATAIRLTIRLPTVLSQILRISLGDLLHRQTLILRGRLIPWTNPPTMERVAGPFQLIVALARWAWISARCWGLTPGMYPEPGYLDLNLSKFAWRNLLRRKRISSRDIAQVDSSLESAWFWSAMHRAKSRLHSSMTGSWGILGSPVVGAGAGRFGRAEALMFDG